MKLKKKKNMGGIAFFAAKINYYVAQPPVGVAAALAVST